MTKRGILFVAAMSCAVLANAQSPVTISPASIAAATSGTPYLQALTATGGSGAPYTWSAVLAGDGAQLPSWLTLSSVSTTTAALAGTPPANGTLSISVTAQDRLGVSSSPLTLNLPINFAGTVFDGILGNLPAGMAIINLSAASGTPTVGGNGAAVSGGTNQSLWYQPFNSASQLLEYTLPPGTYTMRVIDPADAAAIFPNLNSGQLSSMWTAWTFNSPWLTDFLVFDSLAASNSDESQLFSGAGGSPGPLNPNGAAQAYSDAVNGYTNANNALVPPYLNYIFPGNRNATPQQTVTFPQTGSGPETVIFSLPDSDISDNSGGVSILIAPFISAPTITTSSLSNGQVGVTYTPTQMYASGGNGTYTWTATGLPNGLTVSSSGVLSGFPTFTGSFPSVFFTVTDPVSGLSFTQTTPFHMTMGAPSPALTITTTTGQIPQGELGVTYGTVITAIGGYGEYTWGISGTAPLTISPSGVVSSSGPLSGSNGTTFVVTVTDSAGDTFTSPTYTLLVDGPVSISTSALNPAAVGESWATTFTASGGTTVYIWSATDLPSWLTMSPFGVLSGVPPVATAPGTISFSVTVTDTAGGTNTVPYNLLVNMPVGYLVENAHGGGLLFAPGDGSAISLQAGTNGNDVVEDAGGNAVVASGTGLYRITPFGDSVSTVATTPAGSSWVAVAVDAFGYFIVGDNLLHEIWRVSPDGVSTSVVEPYTVTNTAQAEDIKILVDVHGNYIVAEDNSGAVQLYSITPAGVVTPVTLTGAIPKNVSGFALGQNGNYQLLDSVNQVLYRITSSGVVTTVDIGLSGNPGGLAINPLTNQAVTASPGQVAQVLSSGLTALSGSDYVESPAGLATLTEDFPSTVDATYPLAYFRLETISGSSEINSAFSYNLTGTGGAATISNPGAPIGIPANNGVVLDGQTGEITTSLTGQIATAGSMMAWVKLAQLPSNSSFPYSYIAGESAQANDFDLQFNSFNVLGFYTTCCGSSLPYTPDPTTLVGQWHMVVATFDAVAGTRAIYWDGSLVARDNCPSCSSYINKTGNFRIGNTSNFSNFGNRYLNGSIDEVGVWNYALTAPQVYRMYASRPAASTGITSSLSPNTAPYQAPTQLTITGQNYSSGCEGCVTVLFTPQGSPTTILTPSSQTSTQVTVTIPAQQLGIPGPASVAVARLGVPSNAIPFTVQGPPALSIAPSGSTLVGGQTFQSYSQMLTASGGTGNYSWSIISQSQGLNLSLSASTGTTTSLVGTPTAASTGDPWVINVLLTDTVTNLTLPKSYFVSISPLAPQGAPPVNITAYVLNQDDSLAAVTSSGDSVLDAASTCNACYDMARDAAGNLIVAAGSQLNRFTSSGSPLTPVTAPGYMDLFSVAVDSSGNYIVGDGVAHKILRISPVSPFAVQLVAPYPVNVQDPEDVFVRIDASGNYIVVEDNNLEASPPGALSLFSITPAGVVTAIAVTPVSQGVTPTSIRGLTFDASGNYIVSDPSNHIIFSITAAGTPNAGTATPFFTDPNQFLSSPGGIYFDAFSGVFFLSDPVHHALYTLTQDGSLLTEIASGTPFAGGPNTVVVEDAFSAPSMSPSTLSLPSGQVGQSYSQTLTASGGSGNYSWSITNQSVGLNLSLTTLNATQVLLTGTPTSSDTGSGLQIAVKLTDATTLLAQTRLYSIVVSQAIVPVVAQPSGTTAVVLVEDGSLVSVVGNVAASFVPASGSGCTWCSDMARDASGNLIVAAGNQLTRYTSSGTALTPVGIVNGSGSQYASVALDPSGNYIVADNLNHQILRISPTSPFAIQGIIPYLVGTQSGSEDAFVRVDSTGNYILAEDHGGTLSLFSITPSGVVTAIPVTPAGGDGGPATTGGLTFDAAGNYVDVDWIKDAVYTIGQSGSANAGVATPLFADTLGYLSDPEGIYRDPVSGYYFLVDDGTDALYTFASDGSNFGQIASGSLLANGPGSLVVIDTTPGQPLSFTPAPGNLVSGETGQPYTQPLVASGGSGNYSWSIAQQSTGLNLTLSASTGPAVNLSGIPTVVNTGGSLAVDVSLTDTSTSLTLSQTYSIIVNQGPPPTPGSWTISAKFTDGGTLTGSFVVNPTTSTVSNWNLVTTTGSTLAGLTYTPSTSIAYYYSAGTNGCAGPCLQFISNEQFPDGGNQENQILDLSFVGSLTSGGTLNLYIDNSSDTASHECLDCNPVRLFTSGSATAAGVPIGVQPSGTTAYVLNYSDSVTQVTNGAATGLVPVNDFETFDIARDAAGKLIVAAGYQLQGYTSTGAVLSGSPLATALGEEFYTSVAIDASGNYIVADTGLNQILRIAPPVNGVARTPYVVASFSGGGDAYVRVDSSGNYIVVTDDNLYNPTVVSLFRITPAGVVTSIPITPAAQSAAPVSTGGLTFDANGNYVNIDWKNRFVSTIVAYGAPNAGASTPLFADPNNYLSLPLGIRRDPLSGEYFLVDSTNDALYTLSPDGSTLTQIASGSAFSAPDAVVVADAVPPGTTDYVLQSNYNIVPIGPGSTVSCPSSVCPTGLPTDIALDASGNFIVASVSALAKITRAGVSSVISTPPSGSQWVSVAVDSSGYFIVADNVANRIVRISPDGTKVVQVATFPVLQIGQAEDVFVRIDSQGNYIVAEDSAQVLSMFRISTSGTVTPITLSGTVPASVGGFTLDAAGNYVIADYRNALIDTITPAGVGSVLFSNSNETLSGPRGIYRDPVTGNFLIADLAGALYSLTPDGSHLTLITNQLTTPTAVVSVGFGITTTSLPSGTQGQTYAPVTLTATGGSGSYSWLATGLPSGMSVTTGGVLSGVPGASGPFTVQLTATDSASHTAVSSLSLTIAAGSVAPPSPPVTPPLSITTSSLPNGTVGVSYGPAGMTATGGSGSYSWSISGAPAGLGMTSSGLLSGTPTAAGTFPVTVTVTNAGLLAQQSYSIAIGSAPLTLNGPASLSVFAPSAAVSAAYIATGGIAPYKWSATGLPTGLSIDPSSGTIGGSVALPGSYTFVVQVTDSQPVSTSINGSVSILGISTKSLPDSSNKIPYSQALAAVGGNGSYTWALTGALPSGLGLSGSGVLSGTPLLAGTPASTQAFTFGVTVTSAGITVSATLSLNVTLLPQPLTIPGGGDSLVALASGPVQVGYSQAIQAAGGTPPYSWSILAGSLPDGLGLNTSGTISGTPARVGSFGFTAHATDASGGSASAGFTIAITAPALTITTVSPLPNGIAGSSYPPQPLTASGGTGPYTFQVSGTLPAGLAVSDGIISGIPTAAGNSSFTVTATDSTLPTPLTASTDLAIPVGPPHADLVLSHTSLSFSFNAGAHALPSGPNSARVTVASNSSQDLSYSLTVIPAVSWLDVTGGGPTPGGIDVTVDPKALNLAPGIVKTSVVVTCVTPSAASQPSPCAGNTQTVNVSLNVISAPSLLSVGPAVLSFSAQTSNPQTSARSLVVQNAGGGVITVNSITAPAGFVAFSGVPSTIPASGSAYVNVNVNSAGLAAGFYQSTILVDTSAGAANIPVTLFVSPNATMTLNPSGTQFQMVAGASPGNSSGSFQVGVSSTTSVSWHPTVLPGAPWLQLANTSVASTSAAPGTVSFSINSAAASLSPQAYYGTIQVTSGTLANSPQYFLVVLNVVAAPSAVQPDPEPAGLLFISSGTSALPSQTVQVFASSSAPVNYFASSDSSWLSVATGTGVASIASPGSSTVSVNVTGLSPGIYYGGVSYQFAGSGLSTGVRIVNVTLLVEQSGAVPADRPLAIPQQQTAACKPSQLVPTQTGLVNAFAQPASWPTPLNVLLTDDCANPITAGQIVATFSNGDAPLQLSRTDSTSGNYSATWTPRNASTQITISARATASGFPAALQQITGQVTAKATPLLTPNGTLNAFSPVVGAAIAPGTIIQIYGSNLAGQAGAASAIPLPNKINSTSVLIGGLQAPLYYVSPGQINAQVPFELSAGSQYQVIVNANGALSTPNPIQLSPDAPGIAVFAAGQVIAQHLDGSLVQETSPAAPGEVIVFYAAGLGQTNQTIDSGTASPSGNLAEPLDTPTLTLGGMPVTNILFAGLTPTLVGLYQVDFQVPATAPNGDLQMVLTQATGDSNTTVLPVHN